MVSRTRVQRHKSMMDYGFSAFIYWRHFLCCNLVMEKQAGLFNFPTNTEWKKMWMKERGGSARFSFSIHPAAKPSDVRRKSLIPKNSQVNENCYGSSGVRLYVSSVLPHPSTDACEQALCCLNVLVTEESPLRQLHAGWAAGTLQQAAEREPSPSAAIPSVLY